MDGYCEGIGSVGCEMVFFSERTGKQRCSRDITPQLTHYRRGTQPPLLHLYENSCNGPEPKRIQHADIQ
jgi:hypothetical protein